MGAPGHGQRARSGVHEGGPPWRSPSTLGTAPSLRTTTPTRFPAARAAPQEPSRPPAVHGPCRLRRPPLPGGPTAPRAGRPRNRVRPDPRKQGGPPLRPGGVRAVPLVGRQPRSMRKQPRLPAADRTPRPCPGPAAYRRSHPYASGQARGDCAGRWAGSAGQPRPASPSRPRRWPPPQWGGRTIRVGGSPGTSPPRRHWRRHPPRGGSPAGSSSPHRSGSPMRRRYDCCAPVISSM